MKILIVEDDVTFGSLIKMSLEEHFQNAQVTHVISAEQAEVWLSSNKPDLVIADVNLPWKSGIILARIVKKLYPDTGIIMMTGINHITSEELKKYSFVGFLKKPFDVKKLTEMIENFLRKKTEKIIGRVEVSSIVDILQLYAMERKKICVRVKKNNIEGKVYMDKGKILHAELGNKQGREALKEIILLKGGTIETFEESPSQTTIDESTDAVLIDALREIDEVSKENL